MPPFLPWWRVRHRATLYLALLVTELANCGRKDRLPRDFSVALYQAQMGYFQPIADVYSWNCLENAVGNTE